MNYDWAYNRFSNGGELPLTGNDYSLKMPTTGNLGFPRLWLKESTIKLSYTVGNLQNVSVKGTPPENVKEQLFTTVISFFLETPRRILHLQNPEEHIYHIASKK